MPYRRGLSYVGRRPFAHSFIRRRNNLLRRASAYAIQRAFVARVRNARRIAIRNRRRIYSARAA